MNYDDQKVAEAVLALLGVFEFDKHPTTCGAISEFS